MKLYFTEPDDGRLYVFEFNVEPSLGNLHVEVTAFRPPYQCPATTIRYIEDQKVMWDMCDSHYISDNFKKYLDKVIKNLAFI
jgi:hypothetical protein